MGVVTLAPQPVTLTTELAGRTSPFEIAEVRPQVGGIIKARLFVEGGPVRAGQVLYQIDPAQYRAALDQARGQLANAVANLADTRAKAERYAGLVKINAVSKQDYDDAEAAYKQALANVAQQKAAVETAAINLGWTSVKAPIAGRAGISAVTKGALVTPSQANALTTVQRLDPIYVDMVQSAAQVTALRRQIDAGRLVTGGPDSAEVRLILDDGSNYPLAGALRFTDVTVDQTTGAVTLRAVFPNPQGLLLPGMFVRAQVVEATEPAGLLVPQQAVSRDPRGQASVMIVGPDGRAQLRLIDIGQAVGNQWLVQRGLAAGDRVIVQGLLNAHPGEVVRAEPFNPALG
ncbi:MAG TPA: efflux RND transporter periplasmic adaptor subunit [Caulobacteraceae bacterium]|nr:efflux RND transporter periplasmic adaptor subunit [Caulobacteraceae bacterium]